MNATQTGIQNIGNPHAAPLPDDGGAGRSAGGGPASAKPQWGTLLRIGRLTVAAALSFMAVGCCSTRPRTMNMVLIDRPDASRGKLAVQIDWTRRDIQASFVSPDALLQKDAIERHPCARAELSGDSMLLVYDHDFAKFVDQMEMARRAGGKHVGERRTMQILGQDVLVADWEPQIYLASLAGKVFCRASTEAEMARLISSARNYLAVDPGRRLRSGDHFELEISDPSPYRSSPLVGMLDRIAPVTMGYATALRHVESLTVKHWYSADASNEYTRVTVRLDSERWTHRIEEAWTLAKQDARRSPSQPHRIHFLNALSVSARDGHVELLWRYPNKRNSISSAMFEEFVTVARDEAPRPDDAARR